MMKNLSPLLKPSTWNQDSTSLMIFTQANHFWRDSHKDSWPSIFHFASPMEIVNQILLKFDSFIEGCMEIPISMLFDSKSLALYSQLKEW